MNLNEFELLQGEEPFLLLDRHPDGIYVAMHVETADTYSAAVWNTETKLLAWSPENAHALAWFHEGTQIAALENPILSEDFLFSVYSWPQTRLLRQCALHFPMGYVFDLFISPTNDLALCQWTDQSEFGFEFISIQDDSVTYLAKDGFCNRKTNFSTRPLFSPDGRIWVCCYQHVSSWWVDEDTIEHFYRPRKGGKREIGGVMVFRRTQQVNEIPLTVTVPAGYLPPGLQSSEGTAEEVKYISDPVFIDAHHLLVRLPSGESQVYDLSKFWN